MSKITRTLTTTVEIVSEDEKRLHVGVSPKTITKLTDHEAYNTNVRWECDLEDFVKVARPIMPEQ